MLVALYGGAAHGQSVDQWIAWGDAASARGEHYGASRFYAGALALEPGRMALQWKQAEALRLSNQYPQAAALYARVAQKDMGHTYPAALRWLGEMQLCDGNYTEALSTWNKVLQKEKDKTSTLALRARNAIEGCALAARSDTAADPITLDHLPQPVNTFDSEFGARSGPDSALWFSSLRGELNADEEVQDTATYHVGSYVTRRSGAGWEEPMKENHPSDAIGTEQANLVWSSNGERIFFTRMDPDGSRSICTALKNGPGEVVQGLGVGYISTQPWIASVAGTELLFFASDRPDGLGGLDIWLGDLVGTGVVNVRNAGSIVNSAGNESSPSYDESTGTLWFSSDFHPGLGGYDIFQSTWKEGAFTNPFNARTPINSSANDLYPVFNARSGEGWLTSNRKGSFAAKGETCCNDLYRWRTTATRPIPPVAPLPQDTLPTASSDPERNLLQLQADFPLKLYFHNDEPEPRSWATTTGQTYATIFTKYQALFPTYRNENADPTRINSFFNTDVERGREKLDALVLALIPVLAEGQRVVLDVRGHASPLAKNDYNNNLSLRRIESLRQHLSQVDNGRLRAYLDSTASNGGVLRINVLPFGEDRSASGVSDDLGDLKHSVYSVEAARERRIEVERVVVEPSTAKVAGDRSFDVGTVHQSEQRAFNITFKNTGTSTLRILRGRTSCDCIQVQHLPDTVAPQGSAVIQLLYTGRARPGPLERTIILDTDGTPSQIELTIHGTVIE